MGLGRIKMKESISDVEKAFKRQISFSRTFSKELNKSGVLSDSAYRRIKNELQATEEYVEDGIYTAALSQYASAVYGIGLSSKKKR